MEIKTGMNSSDRDGGAATLGTMTQSMTALSIKALSIMTLSMPKNVTLGITFYI